MSGGKKTIVFSKTCKVNAKKTLLAGSGVSTIHDGVIPGQRLSSVAVREIPGGHSLSEVNIRFEGELTGNNVHIGEGHATTVNYANSEQSAEGLSNVAVGKIPRGHSSSEVNSRFDGELTGKNVHIGEGHGTTVNYANPEQSAEEDEASTTFHARMQNEGEDVTEFAEELRVMEEEKLARATEPKQH